MKKTFKTIFFTITICFLILIIKNEYSRFLLFNSSYGMPALIKQQSIDNLFLGSSMFRQGIDIITLEEQNPNNNWILAYNGNQPVLEYYQLKNLLNHNIEIKNLYVDMYVYSAWESPEINDKKLFLETGIIEKVQLWKLICGDSLFTNFENFWQMFVSSNNELLLTWFLTSPIINSQFYRGGSLIKTSNASPETLDASSILSIKNSMDPSQEYYLKKLIQLSKTHNINIIFLETPKYEKITNDSYYISAMQKYLTLLEHEQVPYILSENTKNNLNLNNYINYYKFDSSNHEYFMDSIHLSSIGRSAFTPVIPLP